MNKEKLQITNHDFIIYKDDFEDLLIFELIYSEDVTQTEKVIIDVSNL